MESDDGIDVIDKFEYYGGMAWNHVPGDEKANERCAGRLHLCTDRARD